MLFRFYSLSFLLFTFSCQSEAGKQTAQTADKICACYQPLIEVNAELRDLLDSGNSKSAEALFPKVAARNKAAKECTKDTVKKLGKDAVLDAEILQQSLNKNCPKVWEQVEAYLFEE